MWIWGPKPLRETFLEQHLSFTDQTGNALGHLMHTTPVSIEKNQVAVVFSFDRPLSQQLDEAHDQLKALYGEIGAIPAPRARLDEQRLALLLTLDARAAGAHWREIARLHPGDQTSQTVRDKIVQARKVWRKIQNYLS
jgi:hypothetical protein